MPTDGEEVDLLEILPATIPDVTANELTVHLSQFEEVMLAEISNRGLPSEGVLVTIDERRRLLSNLDDAIDRLEPEHRQRSLYLSKFIMAAASGLFDAALNYLWDETIAELRRRVSLYDLSYFYDLAVTAPERRKRLQGPDDITQVEDSELIRASNVMGLVSDVGYRQLDLVRYMRNYASAAHPNQNELTGLQLVGFVETCIREVITLPESSVVTEVRRLLANLKANPMDATAARTTAAFFNGLPQSQADNLGQGFFGIYVDQQSSIVSRDNVRLLTPYIWPLLSEGTRQGFGVRYGRFIANNDQEQAALARELLDAVDATSYLPESVRAAEIDEELDSLRSAHEAMNNFYNEPPIARRLQVLVGSQGVPPSVRSKYVATLIEVALGRRSGVAWSADPIYRSLIGTFTPDEARLALLAYALVPIASKLQFSGPRERYEEILELLEPKLTDRPSRELFEAVRQFAGPRENMSLDANLRRLSAAVPR